MKIPKLNNFVIDDVFNLVLKEKEKEEKKKSKKEQKSEESKPNKDKKLKQKDGKNEVDRIVVSIAE